MGSGDYASDDDTRFKVVGFAISFAVLCAGFSVRANIVMLTVWFVVGWPLATGALRMIVPRRNR